MVLLNSGMQQENPHPYWITKPSIAIPLIVLVSGVIFFWALGEPAYWDRDEPRNAGCAAEMMARGDWVVPIFNDQLRQQKPPLLYWLMGVAYSMFGVNEFAGRFFSALLGIGTVVATWSITKHFFDRSTALLASLMLSSSLMFCVAARAATPDSALIFCVTMAIWFFVRGHVNDARPRWKNVSGKAIALPFTKSSFVGIYLFLGLAMLAKGPVGFLLPMAVMGWYLLQQDWLSSESKAANASLLKRIIEPFAPQRFLRTLLSMRPFSGAALSLLIAAPWFVAVGIATDGEFLRRFFFEENFGRATQVLENHGGGWWFYPVAILIGFFPWSLFWGPVVIGLFVKSFQKGSTEERAFRLEPGVRFAIAWIVIQVVAFSLVKTKLPSYVTPCYPALAMLTAHASMQLVRGIHVSPDWIWKSAHATVVLSGIGMAIGFWIAADQFAPIPDWLFVLGLFPLATGILGWLMMRSKNENTRMTMVVGSGLAAALLAVGLLGVGAGEVGRQNRMPLADSIRQQTGAQVATYGCLESSWVYYSEKPIVELRTDGHQDASANRQLEKRNFWDRKPRLSPQQFADRSGEQGLIITTARHWQTLKPKLPAGWKVFDEGDWFMKDEQLLLIGNTESRSVANQSINALK